VYNPLLHLLTLQLISPKFIAQTHGFIPYVLTSHYLIERCFPARCARCTRLSCTLQSLCIRVFSVLSLPYHPGASIHCSASLTSMYLRIFFIIRPYYSMDPELHTSLHTLSHTRPSLVSHSEIYSCALLTFQTHYISIVFHPSACHLTPIRFPYHYVYS
jgi:hypothetical protein